MAAAQLQSLHLGLPPAAAAPRRRRRRRPAPPRAAAPLLLADLGGDLMSVLKPTPELSVAISGLLAAGSVFINLQSGITLEKERTKLQLQLERDRAAQTALRDVQGVIARYRGPLLEAAIDMEQRLWHLCAEPGRDGALPPAAGGAGGADAAAASQQATFFLFCLAQLLAFMEVVRREAPRERAFLQAGNPQGSDTLAALLEGVRFVLSAPPAHLEDWHACEGERGAPRSHPGARRRRERAWADGDGDRPWAGAAADAPLLLVPRPQQRAVGSVMITTPPGAERHYTVNYAEFAARLEGDPTFGRWFGAAAADFGALAAGPPWRGEPPFPLNRWSRALLLHQLLVEAFAVLDPDAVRLPLDRRARLARVEYAELPGLAAYTRTLRQLSGLDDLTDTRIKEAVLGGLRAAGGGGNNGAPLAGASFDGGDDAGGGPLAGLLRRRR